MLIDGHLSLLLTKVHLDLTAFARDVRDAMKIRALTDGELANATDFYGYVSSWLSTEPSVYWPRNADRAQKFIVDINEWRRSVTAKVAAAKQVIAARAAGAPPPAITPISISVPAPIIKPSILGPILAAVVGAAATGAVAVAFRGKKKLDITHRLGKPEDEK